MSNIITNIAVEQKANIDGSLYTTGILTPSAIASDVNNYNPSGLDNATILHLTSTLTVNVNGIVASTNGRILTIVNIGSTFNIVLTNQNVGSTSTNRFALDGQNQVLLPGQSCTIRYETSSQRWRPVSSSPMGNFGGAVITAGIINPSSLSSDQNDYNPTGLVNATVIRLTSTTVVNINGIVGGSNGRILTTVNKGSFNIILTHENTGSTASNRFALDGQNVVLLPGQTCSFRYDSVLTRWLSLSSSPVGNFGGTFITAGVLSPATISTNQNDYNPTGLVNAAVLRLSSSSNIDITGLVGGTNGRKIILINISTFSIKLKDQSILSLAQNRFKLSSDITMVNGTVVGLIYDGVSNVWRTSGSGGGGGAAGGIIQSNWVEIITDVSTTTDTWPTPNTVTTLAGVLPTATITVNSTSGFPTSGQLYILTANNTQIVTYTGTTGTTFTGCTGGSGAYILGAYIWGGPTSTTIAAGSNGQTLPQATINVVSTTAFPTSGILLINTSLGAQIINYTGKTPTTFTGCTGGSGVLSLGGSVVNVSVTPQDILRIDMTTNGGDLIISVAISCTTKNNCTAYFQVIVDGVFRRGASTRGNGAAPAGSTVIGLKIAVPIGAHSIVVRWRVQNVSTPISTISPVTLSEDNNGSLLVQEVAG
jgi:hypothetical protein